MDSIKLLALGYLSILVLLTTARTSYIETNRELVFFLFLYNEVLVRHIYVPSVGEGNTTHSENSWEHEMVWLFHLGTLN